MATELDAARLLVYRAAWLKDQGQARVTPRVRRWPSSSPPRPPSASSIAPSRSTAAAASSAAPSSSGSTARSAPCGSTKGPPRSSAWSSRAQLLRESQGQPSPAPHVGTPRSQRIRHVHPLAGSADVARRVGRGANGSLLFSPLSAGRLQLADRTWVPAMVPWRATDDGFVTDDVLAWYERFAEGQPGAIVVEATGVRDIPSGPLLRIGDDRFIPGLARAGRRRRAAPAADARSCSSRSSTSSRSAAGRRARPTSAATCRSPMRIAPRAGGLTRRTTTRGPRRAAGAAGRAAARRRSRRASSRRWTSGCASASPTSSSRTSAICRRRCPASLPRRRGRAEAAGFDGVELHYAHAYTMASFLSARNTRADGYGGSREAPRAAAARGLRTRSAPRSRATSSSAAAS